MVCDLFRIFKTDFASHGTKSDWLNLKYIKWKKKLKEIQFKSNIYLSQSHISRSQKIYKKSCFVHNNSVPILFRFLPIFIIRIRQSKPLLRPQPALDNHTCTPHQQYSLRSRCSLAQTVNTPRTCPLPQSVSRPQCRPDKGCNFSAYRNKLASTWSFFALIRRLCSPTTNTRSIGKWSGGFHLRWGINRTRSRRRFFCTLRSKFGAKHLDFFIFETTFRNKKNGNQEFWNRAKISNPTF